MSSLIYLASPYTHEDPAIVDSRVEEVYRKVSDLMKLGYTVFSPIAHCHDMAKSCDLPTDWEFWNEYDKTIISRCDELWVLKLPGWQNSHGVKAEIQIAMELGKQIRYLYIDEELPKLIEVV